MDNRGQGALEYLLLIAGAVLIATIVLLIIIGTTDQTNGLIDTQLNNFNNMITHQGA